MTQQPEPPDGWKREGPFLFRQHGGSFATIWQDGDGDWASTVATVGDSAASESWDDTLPAAVAWANDQLGVPRPVEVVEEKFADGSRVFKDSEGKRVAFVRAWGDRSRCVYGECSIYEDDDDKACEKAREYVRGAS